MAAKNSHCSYCGTAFDEGAPWPRQCAACGNTTYLNPLPVAVLLLPVESTPEEAFLLMVERADRQGKYALPGGYINAGESWQEAAAREVYEETGVTVEVERIRHFDTRSAPDGTVLIFGVMLPPLSYSPDFLPSPSITPGEIVARRSVSYNQVYQGHVPFAFPLHQEVALRWVNEMRLRNDQLRAAVISGEEDTVRQLLAEGGDFNAQITAAGYTNSLLGRALDDGRTSLARLLLEAGANIKYFAEQLVRNEYTHDYAGYYPLGLALKRNDKEQVALLLKFGASPNAPTEACWGWSSELDREFYWWANADNYDPEIILALLDAGAELPVDPSMAARLLDKAQKARNPKPIPPIADPVPAENPPVDNAMSPVLSHDQESVLEAGADPNGNLHIRIDWEARAKREADANPMADQRDAWSWRNQHIAKYGEIITEGRLHHACAEGNENLVRLLLDAGADPNREDPSGFLPLNLAIRYHYPAIVKLLLDKGADPKRQDREGFTALKFAQGTTLL